MHSLAHYVDNGFPLPGNLVEMDAVGTITAQLREQACGVEQSRQFIALMDSSRLDIVSVLDALAISDCARYSHGNGYVAAHNYKEPVHYGDDGVVAFVTPGFGFSQLKLMDTLTPDFVSSNPAEGAVGVARDLIIRVKLTHPIHIPLLQTQNQYLSRYLSLLKDDSTSHGVEVGFTVSLDDKNPRILVIKPIATLDAESRYRLELKPELASRRTSGLFNHIIHFTTGKASNVPLEYVSVAPSSISVDGSEVEIVLANSLNPSFFISEEAAAIIASQPLANNKVRYRLAAPPHYPGSAALRVIEPDGRQLYRLGAVQYVEPLVLDSSSPNLGSANGGTRVVITGKGFIAGGLSTRVFIGGELVASEKRKLSVLNS